MPRDGTREAPVRSPQPGDEVYAVGFPGKATDITDYLDPSGDRQREAEKLATGDFDFSMVGFSPADFEVTITRGVISANREVNDTNWFQHDAVVSGGNAQVTR